MSDYNPNPSPLNPVKDQISPAPWKVNYARSSNGLLAITTVDETQNIASVFGLPMGETGVANAELIARAPALLAQRDCLLEAAQSALIALHNTGSSTWRDTAVADLQRAIALAQKGPL